MLRIGIDYRLATNTNRGIGTYLRELVSSLSEMDRDNEYILYTDNFTDISHLGKNFKLSVIDQKNYILFEQVHLPLAARRDNLDILWCPANTFPIFLPHKIKLFLTLNDLIFMHKSFYYNVSLKHRLGGYYRSFIVSHFKKHIDTVFTISDSVKDEIADVLKLDVIVTHIKIDSFHNLVKEKKQTNILSDLGLTKQSYFYTVSGLTPNKNLDTLLTAFKNYHFSDKLVISGIFDVSHIPDKYTYNNNKVIFTGEISKYEMIDLYRNAKAFIFLSTDEGFGIPVLEALNFPVPIIASDIPPIKEIVDNAAILIDPYNLNEILDAMYNVNSTESKYYYRKKQLSKFMNWEETANVILTAFTKNIKI